MNSQIFVQAPAEISSSELVTPSEFAAVNPQTPTNSTVVPAVIRPFRYSGAEQDSVRLDAATKLDVPAPHHRTHKLDDYVNWLKARVAADQQDARQEEATGETIGKANEPEEASRKSSSNLAKAEVSFGEQELPKPPVPDKSIQRIDAAHTAIASPSASPWKYKSEPDLERIEANLALRKQSNPNEKEANPSTGKQSSHVDISSVNMLKDQSNIDADQIIATVSQAIAAVLTGHSESEIEAKIRSELGHARHQEALASLPPQIAQEIVSDVRQTTGEIKTQDSQIQVDRLGAAEAAEAAEIMAMGNRQELHTATDTESPNEADSAASSEIPTNIAAWDVEEFRWPKVTNQMIATGSKAIGQLVESVFDLIGTSPGRLAVTSAGRGEGATSIAISLSRWAAAAGKRVLLVDADLASPGMSGQIGLGPNISWVNAISNGLAPAEVIIRSQKSQVCVMPMAPITTRVSWPRFIFDLLGELTSNVQSSFDLIVFDVGPVSQLQAELSQSSLMVDVGLLVHSDGSSADFQNSKEILHAIGINKFALAQNSAVQKRANVA